MSRYPQPSDGRGSLRDIQVLVNKYPHLFEQAISNELTIRSEKIDWVSPSKEDSYAEYRDEEFLERLGIKTLETPLNDFWPNKGPQWDGLGKGSDDEVFIVEAKANLPEIGSPPSGAGEKSLQLIRESLNTTKSYLGINNNIDWSGKFYQYTNRLAHLYYLRVLNGIPAYLIFLYFIGDDSVNGPNSINEWNAAISDMKEYLGIEKHKLSGYIADVFIDVKDSGFPFS